ncbi:MAG: FAD:protein FMN transferase [Bacillota bacterium]
MLKNIKKICILLILLFMQAVLLSACGSSQIIDSPQPISKTTFLLGTVIDIKIFDKSDEAVIDEAFKRISEIEKKMTINNAETSEIIKLNEESGKKAVNVSSDTLYVLKKGRYYSELSKGLFDITAGPIVKLWNIGTDYAAVPDSNTLAQKLQLVNYEKLTINEDASSAELEQSGMAVDLGAIAKGYAADEATAILRKHGVKHAIINLGGNMVVIGDNPNGNPWKIGIQDPDNPRGDYMGIIPLTDQTVVTSGIYERFLEKDGRRYHHILDTRTGFPADNNLSSVSIITDSSIDADALSTTTFIMGLEEGFRYIEALENVEAIFITKDKKVYLTSGIKDRFVIVKKDYIQQ